MPDTPDPSDDVRTLHKLGYAEELARVLGGFSNFAISLSIICILAGGVTSFQVGYCTVGGASVGLGWPLAALTVALLVAALRAAPRTALDVRQLQRADGRTAAVARVKNLSTLSITCMVVISFRSIHARRLPGQRFRGGRAETACVPTAYHRASVGCMAGFLATRFALGTG